MEFDSKVVFSALPLILPKLLKLLRSLSACLRMDSLGSTAFTINQCCNSSFVKIPVPEPMSAIVEEEVRPHFSFKQEMI